MTAGLHVFDAGGNLMLDATTRAGRVFSITYVSSGSGTIPVDPSLVGSGGTFAAFHAAYTSTSSTFNGVPPTITQNGSGFNWSYPSGTAMPGYIVVGGY